VFTWPDGRPIHPHRFSKWFEQHTGAAGLPKIRLHDVRHSYATAALAAGIPAKVVSERLGHANIAITMDTYSHVLPGLDAQAAGTVARPLTKRPAGRRRRREVKANLLVSGGVIEGTRTPGLRDHNLICWFGVARAA
jgi:integrase